MQSALRLQPIALGFISSSAESNHEKTLKAACIRNIINAGVRLRRSSPSLAAAPSSFTIDRCSMQAHEINRTHFERSGAELPCGQLSRVLTTRLRTGLRAFIRTETDTSLVKHG
jgi:hypothetical protein